MDAKKHAHPRCPRCHGTGYIHGDSVMDHRLCVCVVLGQEREAAEIRIKASFPKDGQTMTFASYQTGGNEINERALRAAKNFVEHWDRAREKGWVIGFYGLPASGKTHLAHAIAIALIKRYFVTAKVLNFPEMLRKQRQSFGGKRGEIDSIIDEAIACDFLAIDDLGAEYRKANDNSGPSWVEEQLYHVLDNRIMERKPMVYTTNLTPDLLKKVLDSGNEETSRLWSRFERRQLGNPIRVVEVPHVNRQDPDDLDLLFGS